MFKKLRILEISSTFPPLKGGMERVVEGLSAELALRGHEVTVLTTNLYVPEAKVGEEEMVVGFGNKKTKIKIVRVPNKLFLTGYGFAPAILAWLEGNWRDFDVVHCHGYNRFASEAAVFFLRGRLPTVFTAHGFYHSGRRKLLKKLHETTLGARAARAASACVAITLDDVGEFERMGVGREKIFVVPNGVEVEKFASKPSRKTAKSKNYFEKYSPFVLFVGRVHESKGLAYLLEAIHGLDCNLVVLGKDAGYGEKLRQKLAEMGLSKRVFVVGEQPPEKLVEAYRACELLALPSEWEAFGVVLVEAMAAGKPVVASDRGGAPLIVEEGMTGFIVPYADSQKLRKKIGLLLKNKSLAKKMGEAGRKAAQQYSWKKVAEKTEKLYEKLCEGMTRNFAGSN